MLVEGDQAHLGFDSLEQTGQSPGIFRGIVYPPDQNIFEGDPFPVRQRNLPAGGKEVLQGILPVYGHKVGALFIRSGIQGYGQFDEVPAGKEFHHLRDDPCRGKGNPPVGKLEPQGGSKDLQSLKDTRVIEQRLSHAHKNQVGELLPRGEGGSNADNLIDDLGGLKISHPSLLSRQAEPAAQGTPDLAGKAEGQMVLFRKKDALDRFSVRKDKPEFTGPVLRRLDFRGLQDADPGRLFQFLAERPGQVAHFLKTADALSVKPPGHLDGPERLLAQGNDESLQALEGQIFKGHPSVSCAHLIFPWPPPLPPPTRC